MGAVFAIPVSLGVTIGVAVLLVVCITRRQDKTAPAWYAHDKAGIHGACTQTVPSPLLRMWVFDFAVFVLAIEGALLALWAGLGLFSAISDPFDLPTIIGASFHWPTAVAILSILNELSWEARSDGQSHIHTSSLIGWMALMIFVIPTNVWSLVISFRVTTYNHNAVKWLFRIMLTVMVGAALLALAWMAAAFVWRRKQPYYVPEEHPFQLERFTEKGVKSETTLS